MKGKIGAFIAVLVLAGATANPGYTQDAEHGKTIFKACAACHATDHANRVGPGGVGRLERGTSRSPLSRRKLQGCYAPIAIRTPSSVEAVYRQSISPKQPLDTPR